MEEKAAAWGRGDGVLDSVSRRKSAGSSVRGCALVLGNDHRSGKSKRNSCAGTVRVQGELTAQLAKALAHTANPETGSIGVDFGKFLGGDALAVVTNGDGNNAIGKAEVDRGRFAAGVAMNVCEAFLNHAEDD